MPDYFEAGVFTDNLPAWHGMGLVSPKEKLTAAEVMSMDERLASDVEPFPFFAPVPQFNYILDSETNQTIKVPKLDENGNQIYEQVMAPSHVMNVRVCDNRPVGVVGKRYKVVNNSDAFAFLDSLIDSGEAMYKTAGTLFDGRVVWILAELPKAVKVAGMDSELTNRYILLRNSHDGSSPLTVSHTRVRVVCANTLALALGEKNKITPHFKIRHTQTLAGKLAAARSTLQIAFEYDEALDEYARKALSVEISDDDVRSLFEQLIPTKDNGKNKEGRAYTVAKNKQDAISDLYFNAPTTTTIRGTAWGFLNSVIEYHDHGIVGREQDGGNAMDDNRFERINYRSGPNLIDQAQKLIEVKV